MKILPFFKEDGNYKYSSTISLVKNMGALSEEDAETISGYMESCAVVNEFLSNLRDPITNRLTIPSRTWSDGMYAWTSNHIHYVKNYRVRLPNEFVDHVKSRVAQEFDVKTLNKDLLRVEFEQSFKKVIEGDESYFAEYK